MIALVGQAEPLTFVASRLHAPEIQQLFDRTLPEGLATWITLLGRLLTVRLHDQLAFHPAADDEAVAVLRRFHEQLLRPVAVPRT
ncbi:MAG: hypothetical protein EA400_02430 [Chromatiaceae bacterium]|nr:MAG: hypothetical protein EA400_02430 [Chromatiaceae bacterium]